MDGQESDIVSFSQESHEDFSDEEEPPPNSYSESQSNTNKDDDDDDDDGDDYEVASVDHRELDEDVRKEVAEVLSSRDKNRSSSQKQFSSSPRSHKSKVVAPATIPEHSTTSETVARTSQTSSIAVAQGAPSSKTNSTSIVDENGTDLEGKSYHFNESSHSQVNSLSPPVSSLSPARPRPVNDYDVRPNGGNKRHSGQGSGATKSISNDGLTRRSGHRRTNGVGSGRSSAAGGPRISWKADPEKSFSDWRIEVFSSHSGGDRDVYHIHRNICGFGPRKSDYLLQDFRSPVRNAGNEGSCVTRLDLPAARARVFPMVLDFMYHSKEAKQTLTAERACHVFKLAELLAIPGLQKAVADFYMKNLSLKNMGEFLTAANQNKAEPLLVVSKAKIGQMITEKPELSGLVPPKFLSDILLISRKQLDEAREKDPIMYSEELVKSQSRYWSKAACICASHNESILTRKLFETLTSEESLPHIDASVAPKLLALDAKFNPQEGNRKTSGQFTSLQRRCVDSISDDFHAFQKGFSSPEAVSETLMQVPSHVLAEILVKSMNRPNHGNGSV